MSVVRWGLIGAGDIAKKRIAPAFRDLPNCELTSVSRFRSDLAEAFAMEFGAKKWFSDWHDLVTDDEIDAVYIATPVYLHARQTIAAAEAGKHVLCEKPMALGVDECEKMIAACRANNVKLGIAYYRRFYPAIGRIKQIIAAGEIGKITFARIDAFEFFDPPPDDPRRWLLDRDKSGGGPMMDFGCHRVEILLNLFGPVRRLESIVSNDVFGREVEDTAAAHFQFENGTCAALTVTHAASEPRDTLELFGTKGSISLPALNQGEMTVTAGGETRIETHPPAANVHGPLIEDFADTILHDDEVKVSGTNGRDVAAIIAKIYEQSF